MNSTFSPSSRAALEHKKSLGQRKIGHNAHASTKGAGAFYAIADNAAVWKPAFRVHKTSKQCLLFSISFYFNTAVTYPEADLETR